MQSVAPVDRDQGNIAIDDFAADVPQGGAKQGAALGRNKGLGNGKAGVR